MAYSDEADLEPVLAPFIADGLAQGDKVLYLTDVTHPAVVTGLLRAWGVRPDEFAAGGRLDVRPLTTNDPGSLIGELTRAARLARREGYRALRVTAEMSWGLREGTERLVAFETDVHSLYDSGMAMGVCQYDRRLFDPVVLAEIQRIHQEADTDLEFAGAFLRIHRTGDPPGLRVEGEVDANSLDPLAEALTAAGLRCRGDVHVDLSGVSFIDLSGMRALVDTAQSLGSGRSLILAQVPEHVHQLFKLIGWDGAPGLRLRGRDGP